MKKLALIATIILGLSMTTFADPNGGLFQRGTSDETASGWRTTNADEPALPAHGQNTNYDANGPIGSGIAVLLGLGAAYLVGKKRKESN